MHHVVVKKMSKGLPSNICFVILPFSGSVRLKLGAELPTSNPSAFSFSEAVVRLGPLEVCDEKLTATTAAIIAAATAPPMTAYFLLLAMLASLHLGYLF